jgi:hypothetical protein
MIRPTCHRRFLPASMNSTPSKVFTVIVMNCENPSHGRKIAGLLRASFPHRPGHTTADEPSTDFSIMVKADSPASVRTAISSALGKARAAFAEMSWLSESGEMSAEPPNYIQFAPPRRLRISPAQR